VLLDTSSSVADQLLDLRQAGIQVSLDDFGTGFSSLTYLQRFDIDFLKIDQSFVRHLVPGGTELALCKAIIVMAHELGMKVVAEGVETTAPRDLPAGAPRYQSVKAWSRTSTQWRTGTSVPLCRCVMQPMLADTMVSGASSDK
jgi:predicted signal transduction protein with EAL and GGDEF domain